MLITINNGSGNPAIFTYRNDTLQGKYRCRILNYWTSNAQFSASNANFYLLYSQQLYNPIGNSPLIISLGDRSGGNARANLSKDGFYFDVNLSGVISFEIVTNTINRQVGVVSAMALFSLLLDLEKII